MPKFLRSANNDCPYFELPNFGATLRALWAIYKAPQTEIELEPRLTESHLGRFIADLALAASVLDDTKINISSDQLRQIATPGLLTVLDLIQALKTGRAELWRADASNLELNILPMDRWRESATVFIQEQLDLKDTPGIVREWRSEICSGTKVEYQSRMHRRRGGGDLTQAAIKYRAAVVNSNERAYDAAYGTLRRLMGEKPDLLVQAIAVALLQLVLYRSGRRKEASEVSGSNLPKGFARLTAEMDALSAHCRGEYAHGLVFPSGGVGFEQLSPVEQDWTLFDESNQVVQGIHPEKRESST